MQHCIGTMVIKIFYLFSESSYNEKVNIRHGDKRVIFVELVSKQSMRGISRVSRRVMSMSR